MKVSHRATGGWHRAAFTAAIVVLLAACSGTDDGNSGPAVGPGPPVTTISCPDCPAANVLNVIDGDTFDSSIGRVRFYGIDTPERGEPCFKDATEAARRLLGSVVRLEDGPRRTDSFGRRLAYVYDASGNSLDVQW